MHIKRFFTVPINRLFKEFCEGDSRSRSALAGFFRMKVRSIVFAGILGALVVSDGAVAAGGPSGQGKDAKQKDDTLDGVHDLSLFSFLQSYGPRGRESYPVLVTLCVKGRDGAEYFCYSQPRLRDAVLGVFSFGRGVRDAKHNLDRYKPKLYRAVSRVVPRKALNGFVLRAGQSAAEFTPDINVTRSVCRALNE